MPVGSNNVDLAADIAIGGQRGILVVASDRNDVAHAKLALFRLDPATAKLTALGTDDAGTANPTACAWAATPPVCQPLRC